MSKSCAKVSPKIKSRILSELEIPGCIITKLGKKYNVSDTTIHAWKRQARGTKLSSDNLAEPKANFVEVSVKGPNDLTLAKAQLMFDSFSFTIEGRIKSSSLVAIIKVLEEQPC